MGKLKIQGRLGKDFFYLPHVHLIIFIQALSSQYYYLLMNSTGNTCVFNMNRFNVTLEANGNQL